jgi:hydroxypyruvate isomerase
MKISRKQALKNIAGISALAATGLSSSSAYAFDNTSAEKRNRMLKGNINHAVCRWPFNDIPIEAFLLAAKTMGIKGVDLLTQDEWPLLKEYGLVCSMATYKNASITEGFSNTKNHEQLQAIYSALIPKVAEAGIKNLICFSGNKNGIGEAEGLDNCVKGLAPLVKLAEKNNVVLCMELFNTKVDHPDYQCSSTEWSIPLVDKVGSENFKLLYDIYHMQIMEGNIIATIKKYHKYFAHYHTAGVPGRNEINETQELNYKAIMKAIVETGFTGFVAQEFIPKGNDKLAALNEGVVICDV